MWKSPLVAVLMRYFSRLRFPTLVLVTGTIFLIDLVVPDVIPFVDELLLGLMTLLLAMLKKPPAPPASGKTTAAR
jgi:hypothetical protein